MKKLRLDYFLSLGLKLVEGDKYDFCNGEYIASSDRVLISTKITDTLVSVDLINNSTDAYNMDRFITSFAPRKNTGEQPCGDNAPVLVVLCGGTIEHERLAGDWDWGANTKAWKPDLDTLIKMQDAYDKEQIKPRVKVEYVKCDQSNTNVWDLKLMLENEELFSKDGSHCILFSNNAPTYMISEFTEHGVYRKVETEITWQSEVKSHVENSHSLSLSNKLEDVISCHDNDRWAAEFKGMCMIVASMNK